MKTLLFYIGYVLVNTQKYFFHQQNPYFLHNVISRILSNENENLQFLKNFFFLLLHPDLLMILH